MALVIEEVNLEKFIVVGDRVMVKPKSPQEKTRTGLYLPPGVQENEKIHSGYVLKVGPGYPIPAINEVDEPWHIDTLDFLTPDLSDGLIRTAFVEYPVYGIGVVFLCIAYYLARRGAKNKTIKIAEKLRKLILIAPDPYPSGKGEEADNDSKE